MTTSEYWINREHENIQVLKQRERSYLSEIEAEYQKAIEEINNEIQRDITRYLETEKVSMEDFMKQADKMDVQAFNKKAANYVRRRDFSSKANTELKLYNLKMRVNRLQLLKAKIAFRLDQLGYELEPNLQQYLQTEVVAEYERQAGILGPSVSVTPSQVETLVNGTHQNANWSTRLWANMEETRNAVNKALNSLLLQGVNPSKFATELMTLMKPLEASKSKAMRLLLTESANVQVSVQLDSFQQTGFTEYEYVAEPGACTICQGLSGKIFPLEKAQAGVNRSPMHPYCRCSTLPHEPEKHFKDFLGKGYWKRREANRQRSIAKAEADRANYLEKKDLKKDYKRYTKVLGKERMPNLETFTEMRYTKDRQWQRLQDNYYVKERLKDGRWGRKINPEKQAPHMLATKGKGKSYFYDDVDVQALFDQYAGTGMLDRNRKKYVGHSERVDLPVDVKIGIDTYHQIEANGLIIKHSKGRTHMYPVYFKRSD